MRPNCDAHTHSHTHLIWYRHTHKHIQHMQNHHIHTLNTSRGTTHVRHPISRPIIMLHIITLPIRFHSHSHSHLHTVTDRLTGGDSHQRHQRSAQATQSSRTPKPTPRTHKYLYSYHTFVCCWLLLTLMLLLLESHASVCVNILGTYSWYIILRSQACTDAPIHTHKRGWRSQCTNVLIHEHARPSTRTYSHVWCVLHYRRVRLYSMQAYGHSMGGLAALSLRTHTNTHTIVGWLLADASSAFGLCLMWDDIFG